MSSLTHPEILASVLAEGVVVVAPDGQSRRLASAGAITDQPVELVARGHALDLGDPMTSAWSAGYDVDADAPYQRAMVLGYALARLSPVDNTTGYRLVYRPDDDADVHALDALGATLATWRITGGALGAPSSVSKQ